MCGGTDGDGNSGGTGCNRDRHCVVAQMVMVTMAVVVLGITLVKGYNTNELICVSQYIYLRWNLIGNNHLKSIYSRY